MSFFVKLYLISCVIISLMIIKPHVFVIGDSISIQYGPFLEEYTKDICIYDRKRDNGESLINLNIPIGANGGDSKMVLDYLKVLQLKQTFNPEYLLINCGLHDIKTNTKTGKKQIPIISL